MKKKYIFPIMLFVMLAALSLLLISCNKEIRHEHVFAFGEWEVIEKPTCTSKGLRSRTCTAQDGCTEVQTEEMPTLNHTPGDWVIDTAPTCGDNGSKHLACADCGTTMQTESIPATGNHRVGAWQVLVSATCSASGVEGRVCSVCHRTIESRVLPATGIHNYRWVDEVPAVSCVEAGVIGHYHCDDCDKNFDANKQEVTDLTLYAAHVFGGWIGDEDASCGHAGVIGHYHCSVCDKDFDTDENEIEDVIIPKLQHSYGDWTDIPPQDPMYGTYDECCECENCHEKHYRQTTTTPNDPGEKDPDDWED